MDKTLLELLEQTKQQFSAHPDAQQAIGLRTARGNVHFAVSPRLMEGDYTQEEALLTALKESGDTRVACYTVVWDTGCVDMCSHHFRVGLLALDPENREAYTLLQGFDGLHRKQLKNLLPPKP